MTSLTRSSITGLCHPRRSERSFTSSSSAVDRILHADQSGSIISIESIDLDLCLGFLPSRSSSTVDLSDRSPSVLEKSLLQAQLKRALSCNDTMEATIKRLRTETDHSIDDLRAKNEVKLFVRHSSWTRDPWWSVVRTWSSRNTSETRGWIERSLQQSNDCRVGTKDQKLGKRETRVETSISTGRILRSTRSIHPRI